MSFIFSQVSPSKIGEAAQPYGAADYYGAALDQGIHDQAFQSIYRMSEYHLAQDEDPVLNPTIPASEANHSAQQEGVDLKFTLDPTLDEYNVLMDRKIKERDRNLILSGGADGIMRSAGAVGVGFLGSVLNPLDMALNFVPIVGTGSKVATGAKAVGVGAKVGRALERGIITEQTLAARGIAMKGYTAAIIEGTVGQAITEIPLMISNQQDQTKYTTSDFVTNVALGGAFGAGIHSLAKLGKAIHGKMKEAKLAHSKLTPETHENMAGAALEDFVAGQEIDPARVSLLDDNAGTRAATEEPDFAEIINRADLSDPYAKIIEEADLSDPTKAITYEFKDPETDEILSGPNKLLVSENTAAGQTRDTTTDPAAEAFGAVKEGSPEGQYRVTTFQNDEPLSHESFSTMEEAKAYAKSVAEKKTTEGIKVEVKERVSKASTPESRAKAANDQLTAYKNHESQKATEKAKQLNQEIKAYSTLESVEPHTYSGHLPDLEKDLAKLDDEISELADELGIEAYGDFELDPRLSGDVAAKVDFTRIQQAENPVPFRRWQAFLPENPPGNHTWKAEDVTYATQQFIPEYAPLFKELFELDPSLKEMDIEFDPLLLNQHNAAGMYKGSEDRILIAEDYAQPSTVLHELTHASVVRRMRKDMEKVGELKGLVLEGNNYLAMLRRYAALTENKGFRGIIEAYLKTVKHHSAQHTNGMPLSSSVNAKDWERFSQWVEEPQYGLLNLDEFIAEGLSNRQFQLYLNNIKSGTETVLTKFMKMVKSVFKLEENPNSVLAQFLDGYETAIKSAGDRADGPASLGMSRATVNDIGKPVLQQASNCLIL